MTETAKSKIKNFKNQITEKFNVGEANGFRTYIGKLSPVNVLDMLDDIERSITTDKLSVEKLQEIRVEELKDFSMKTLQAELKNQKLQEQLNTAKYFFKNILDVNPNLEKGSYAHLSNCVNVMKNSAEKALAAIGGDDEKTIL